MPVALSTDGSGIDRVLHLHPTGFRYVGDAEPQAPGGMAAIYRDLIADPARIEQVVSDVITALDRQRNCLVLTQWTAHVDRVADLLKAKGLDPIVLTGRLKARDRAEAMQRLDANANDAAPLLIVATGPYVGEGFDCPRLDTLFLAAPIAFKGRVVQYTGRILRVWPGKVPRRGPRLRGRACPGPGVVATQADEGLPVTRLHRAPPFSILSLTDDVIGIRSCR